MTQLRRWLVWLSRIHRCRGFGIQSPTDYAFVRYVVNEHWPYYAYSELRGDDWLERKLGRLYLRLANWRQPAEMARDGCQRWWQAGCGKIRFTEAPATVELARVDIDDRDTLEKLLQGCNRQSVVVVEHIWRDWRRWREIERDPSVGTTFDLYYCGIVMMDRQRFAHHYKVNF